MFFLNLIGAVARKLSKIPMSVGFKYNSVLSFLSRKVTNISRNGTFRSFNLSMVNSRLTCKLLTNDKILSFLATLELRITSSTYLPQTSQVSIVLLYSVQAEQNHSQLVTFDTAFPMQASWHQVQQPSHKTELPS